MAKIGKIDVVGVDIICSEDISPKDIVVGEVTLRKGDRDFILDVSRSLIDANSMGCELVIDKDSCPDSEYNLTDVDILWGLDTAEIYLDNYDGEIESIDLAIEYEGELKFIPINLEV
jgi:hypothetical protein